MTTQSKMFVDSNLGKAGLTVASIGVVYSLTQSFIKANLEIAQSGERLKKPTREQELAQLSPVQEGDESGPTGALDSGSPKPVMGPSLSGSPKTFSRAIKENSRNNGSLMKSLQSLVMILNEAEIPRAEKSYALPSLSITLFLTILSRTMGEFMVHKVTSQIDEAVLTQNRIGYSKLLSKFVLIGLPVVFVQQLTQLSAANVSSRIRHSLISFLMSKLVLSSHNLCHPEELVDQGRLEALMGDVATASSASVQLASDRAKRLTEIALHVLFLVRTVGIKIPVILLGFLFLTVRISTKHKFFKTFFLRKVSEREQGLKKALSRLQRHRDDIALWNGAPVEMDAIIRHVTRIEEARNVREKFEFLIGITTGLSSRVAGTALGLALAGSQFVSENRPLFQYLLTARVILQLSSSVSSILEEHFLLTLPKPAGVGAHEEVSPATAALVRLSTSIRRLRASLIDLPKQLPAVDALPFRVRKNNLCLSDVTGMSPDGSVLFQSLSLELSPGAALVIRGPPGSGKSALLRIMAGTWPAVMGEISRPRTGVYCVPSKPYLLLEGSLKDQVCYPDMGAAVDQERLQAAIKATNIGHLFSVNGIARSGSGSALMGDSDQQKLMLARLIYHRPKYALLDDCWKHLEKEYLSGILRYLKSDLGCGIVVATVDGEPLSNVAFGFKFDTELILNNAKQPPRHEIIVHRNQ
jgi:ABC-type uncharacterized transport system fused permease/ATPase subunit